MSITASSTVLQLKSLTKIILKNVEGRKITGLSSFTLIAKVFSTSFKILHILEYEVLCFALGMKEVTVTSRLTLNPAILSVKKLRLHRIWPFLDTLNKGFMSYFYKDLQSLQTTYN